MARPRFRRLDYDLYARLEQCRILGSTFQIILVVIDYTIGYQKEEAPISLTSFQDKTYLSRPTIIRAIRDAARRHIVRVCKRGTNPKEATVYAINQFLPDWETGPLPGASKRVLTRTSKEALTSKLVNTTLPDWSRGVNQTSKTSTMTSPIERNYKETPMVKQCNENKLTAIRETIELSNDIGVSGNHDGDTILKYLRNNDKASEPQDISRRTGIALDTIMATLLSLESQRLAANCEGKWWACEVNKHG